MIGSIFQRHVDILMYKENNLAIHVVLLINLGIRIKGEKCAQLSFNSEIL